MLVHSYAGQFIALAALVYYNKETLHNMFKDRLKDTILDRLARDKLPDTLAQLIDKADRVDQREEIH